MTHALHKTFCTVGTYLLLLLNPGVASSADFLIYDATLYSGKPDMPSAGLIPLSIVYEGNADPAWAKTNLAGLPRKASVMAAVKAGATGKKLVCLDYEAWPITAESPDISDAISKLLTVLQWSREAAPNVKFGFYGTPPISDYWGPVMGAASDKGKAWIKANAALIPLANQVDVIFPSLYTFYPDQDQWTIYAISQIKQAKNYGKPVYVFLWPQYHNSNRLHGLDYLPRDYWKRELEIAYQYADGIVIWGGWDFKNNKPASWDSSAEWWQETKDFITKHLNDGKSALPSPPRVNPIN